MISTLPIYNADNLKVAALDGAEEITLENPISLELAAAIDAIFNGGEYSWHAIYIAHKYYNIVPYDESNIMIGDNDYIYLYALESEHGGFISHKSLELYKKNGSKLFAGDKATIEPELTGSMFKLNMTEFYLDFDGTEHISSWKTLCERYLTAVNPHDYNVTCAEYEGQTFSWGNTTRPIDSPAILDYETAFTRLRSICCDLFWKADHPFDWTGVCIAGGSCSKSVDPLAVIREQQLCDVDLFIYGTDANSRTETLRRVLTWFWTPDTYYLVRGSVCTVYIMGSKRKYQIVFSNDHSILQVINRFDFSHVAWAYDGTQFLCTPSAIKSIETRVSKIISYGRLQFERCVKTFRNKYAIERTEHIERLYEHIAIAAGRTEPQTVQVINESLLAYYPHADGIYDSLEDSADREQYITQKIAQDGKSKVVVRTVDEVMSAINVYGNFNDSYGINSIRNFNISDLDCKPVSRTVREVAVRTMRGALIMMTEELECELINGALVVQLNKDHAELFAEMDNKVYKLYCRRPLLHKSVVDNTVRFNIVRLKGYKTRLGGRLPVPPVGKFKANIRFSTVVNIEAQRIDYYVLNVIINNDQQEDAPAE